MLYELLQWICRLVSGDKTLVLEPEMYTFLLIIFGCVLFPILVCVIKSVYRAQVYRTQRDLEREQAEYQRQVYLQPVSLQARHLLDDSLRRVETAPRRILELRQPMTSLASFHTYSVPDNADVLLKRCAANGRCNLSEIVDDLRHNEQVLRNILHQLGFLFSDVDADDEFREDIHRYINQLQSEAREAWICEYTMTVYYHSPGGRSHYDKHWRWSADEIEHLMPKRKAVKTSPVKPETDRCVVHNTEPVPSSQMKTLLATDALHEVSTEAQQTALLAGNFQGVEPQCLEYLATHKCWTGEEYTKLCSHQGKKKVPGCYIIQNQVTGKIYVGQSADLMRRVQEHLNGKQSGGDVLDYDIAVLGHDVLIKHIPLAKSGYLDLNEMERDLIRAYNCVEPKGYNKTRGNGY